MLNNPHCWRPAIARGKLRAGGGPRVGLPNGPSFQINVALKFMAAVAEEGHDLLQRSRDSWEKQHKVRDDGSIDGGPPPPNFGSQHEIVVRLPEVRLVFCLTTNLFSNGLDWRGDDRG